ncbi:MAG: energy-coupling factor transporter transmembrane component T family protein [Lachnospiraceae bacterium]
MANINPSVKTICLLLLGIVLAFNQKIIFNFIIISFGIISLFQCKIKPLTLLKWLCVALLMATSIFFSSMRFSSVVDSSIQSLDFATALVSGGSFYHSLQLATRILAYCIIGLVFNLTTEKHMLVSSYIHQLHLSPKYAYGVLAAVHFTTSLMREYEKVKLAFRVRNISVGPLSIKPFFVMLVNALHWSGDIAAAMESKGFDGTFHRTYYLKPQIHKIDIVFSCGILIFLLLIIIHSLWL